MGIEYAPEAAAQLDALKQSADDQTWDAICDVLELIDQNPDSAQARREEITGSNGSKMWKVPVRSSSVDDLAVLWSRGLAGDYVVFVGVMPFAR
ncbi:hypothetical protein [Candidatus Mycobacterium methanotrophicum]|uniref:Uncharacterized protein n=1 Tax=Candidatus Mycobacterium methanotrophicum TaxID=2943498 RepID=A0ABY4QP42_9MYCO|nr:hypothetical protein [Candidatus Mycobacterium methanotrophicum]UQX11395.1 hypothetical protein M5I08_02405 [Candidatus Mycobacterium methanotrophicum]